MRCPAGYLRRMNSGRVSTTSPSAWPHERNSRTGRESSPHAASLTGNPQPQPGRRQCRRSRLAGAPPVMWGWSGGLGEGDGVAEGFELADVAAGFLVFVGVAFVVAGAVSGAESARRSCESMRRPALSCAAGYALLSADPGVSRFCWIVLCEPCGRLASSSLGQQTVAAGRSVRWLLRCWLAGRFWWREARLA